MKRAAIVSLLPLLLAFASGFAPGPQTSEQEAREKASFVPKLEEYHSKPTVETSAAYNPSRDAWRVVLTEEVSGSTIAYLTVGLIALFHAASRHVVERTRKLDSQWSRHAPR